VPILENRVPVLDRALVVLGLVALLDLAVLIGLFRVRTDRGTTGAP
jgi:hypothetical protein